MRQTEAGDNDPRRVDNVAEIREITASLSTFDDHGLRIRRAFEEGNWNSDFVVERALRGMDQPKRRQGRGEKVLRRCLSRGARNRNHRDRKVLTPVLCEQCDGSRYIIDDDRREPGQRRFSDCDLGTARYRFVHEALPTSDGKEHATALHFS